MNATTLPAPSRFTPTTTVLALACWAAGLAAPAVGVVQPPSWQEAASATYRNLGVGDGPVTLTDGRWKAAQGSTVRLVEDLWVRGDLEGDGTDEAVVLLATSGGDGVSSYSILAILGRAANGTATWRASVPLGDRIQLRSVEFEDRSLAVELVRLGPNDPPCCPGELARITFGQADAGTFSQSSDKVLGRLGPAALEGTSWRLTHWDLDVPATEDRRPTIAVVDGRLVGYTGCNRFSTSLTQGERPGEIRVGPIPEGKNACMGRDAATEARFLQAIGRANKIGFFGGRLLVVSRTEEQFLALLFEIERP